MGCSLISKDRDLKTIRELLNVWKLDNKLLYKHERGVEWNRKLEIQVLGFLEVVSLHRPFRSSFWESLRRFLPDSTSLI